MLKRSLVLAAAGVAMIASTGCTITARQGQIESVGAPGLTPPTYKIVGNVSASAKAFTLSPVIANHLNQSALDRAKIDAVGQAIYNNDEIDLVIAPKTEATVTSFLGLFEMASVTIKGKGVALTGPK